MSSGYLWLSSGMQWNRVWKYLMRSNPLKKWLVNRSILYVIPLVQPGLQRVPWWPIETLPQMQEGLHVLTVNFSCSLTMFTIRTFPYPTSMSDLWWFFAFQIICNTGSTRVMFLKLEKTWPYSNLLLWWACLDYWTGSMIWWRLW